VSSEIIKDAYEDSTDVFDLLDNAESKLFGISETHLRREYKSMTVLIQEALERIKEIRNSDKDLSGVPSGFSELDRATAGWQPSDLIIIAARPGMGKTAFVLSMARNTAIDYNMPVAIFSLEMSALQLVTRLIAAETELSASKLRKGDLKEYEWEQLNVKIKKLAEAKIFIDDTPALTVFELRAKCRRLKYEHNIAMVIVDYLQLMSGLSDNRGGNREQEISNISRSLKSLAKELNVPVIAISQLSRAVETRGGSKRPLLSDLRESGAIEQDADLVLFIYRPEYYKIMEDEQGQSTVGMAEIIIAKHRNGTLKDIKLRFIDKFAKFEEFEPVIYTDGYKNESNNSNSYTIPSKMNDENDDEEPF
ncbi:MAG TPA: replicative DNA helicase, partial [Bacteroidales bacterium]|nr:replicative DNA helicase [Bacteroidales bacterium]